MSTPQPTTTARAKGKAANGDGSLTRKTRSNGSTYWVVELSIGYRPDGTRRRTRRTAATYADAKALRRRLLAEHAAGRLTEIRPDTVATYGLRWIREVKALQVRPGTSADYEARLRREIMPFLGSVRLVDLTGRHVEAWMRDLHAAERSARTINGARQVLKALCKHATRQGLIPHNPVDATDPMKRPPGARTQVRRPWTLEQAGTVLEHAMTHDALDCFLHLMLHTGLRPGEALGLLWTDVNLDEGYFTVTGTYKEERRFTDNGTAVVRGRRNDPKTASSRRRLPISDALAAALVRQQMRHSIARTVEGPRWQDTGYVVTTRVGTPVSPSNNRVRFKAFLAEIDVPYIRPHDMRHTVALLALNDGDIPIEKASQALGHTRIDTTKQIYAGNVPKYNGAFIDGLARVLPPPPTPQIPEYTTATEGDTRRDP